MEKRISLKEMMQQAEASAVNTMPDEVLGFFRRHFNVSKYEWDSLCRACQHLDSLLGYRYKEETEYLFIFDNETQYSRVLQCLCWLVAVFQKDDINAEETAYAFELVKRFPCFWQLAKKKELPFSDGMRIYALTRLKDISCKIDLNLDAELEQHILPDLEKALDDLDWLYLETNLLELQSIFERISLLTSAIDQPFLFLSQHHPDQLLSVIDQEQDKWRLLVWISCLPKSMYIDFAVKLNNKLAVFLILLNLHQTFIETDEELLSEMWAKLDQKTFTAWMENFNRYPVRFPCLQKGLGKFLAQTDMQNIRVYIESLNMEAEEQDTRDLLYTFFKYTDESKQTEFCRLAYEKWLDWDCTPKIGRITRSPLDSAIITYFKTQVKETEREQFISEHIEQMMDYQNIWFENVVDMEKYLWGLLSKIQPPCIAAEIIKNPSQPATDFFGKIFEPLSFREDLRWKYWLRCDLMPDKEIFSVIELSK